MKKILIFSLFLLPFSVLSEAPKSDGTYRLSKGSNLCVSQVSFVSLPSCGGFEIESVGGPYCNVNNGKFFASRSQNGLEISYESITTKIGNIVEKKEVFAFGDGKFLNYHETVQFNKKGLTITRTENGKSFSCIYEIIP
jgi:hypothetical protein